MYNKLIRSLGKKVRLGRTRFPVWTIALGLTLVAAVAGQAVGPVLSGSVQGSAGLVVSQTIVLASAPIPDGNEDDFASTMNDEGTAFTFALETKVGQNQTVTLELDNLSGAEANGILEISAPAGIDVDADEGAGPMVGLARLNRNSFLFSINDTSAGTPGEIVLEIEAKDDAAPGFYTITGRIIQVAN
ncbi:MAG: hypothetical protein HYY01_10905 [Chloroflexi bacterium]|nr:hypothetical protein [Chloroflexota bacterium]